MGNLQQLKDAVFASDNRACFIERERILARLEREMEGYAAPDRYAKIFSALLSEVSVPILDCDYFAGRVMEALPDEGMKARSALILSRGHLSPDYAKLLRVGLRGVLDEIKKNARMQGSRESAVFAENAETVIHAVRSYADRYAREARSKGRSEMADALERVPYEPAYDFYSALQSVWMIHMIASCYVGARDYAFGRFDQFMLPYYEKALRDGKTEEYLTELLAGFFMKTNEICGRGTHNWQSKPVPCQASKQYVNIGGEKPNRFSRAVLNAAKMNCMAQPQIVVLLKPEADPAFTNEVFEALSVLTDKMNLYHYDLIVKGLIKRGIEPAIARDFTYSACCTFDLNYHTSRWEYYVPTLQIFLKTLHAGEFSSVDELLKAYSEALREDMQKYADGTQRGLTPDECRKYQVFDSVLLSDSAKECHYADDGNAPYNILNLFCPGIATLGDSLTAIDKLVFKEKRYSMKEFVRILGADFEGNEDLRREILRMDKFGNDTDADEYAAQAGNAFMDAVDALHLRENFYAVGGFYSLERDNIWAAEVGATPDGRKAGMPFSENQSPSYGADKSGITALLKSVSKLPLGRTANGGLNLTFSRKMPANVLKSLVLTYFSLGGFHVGISVLDRETLRDAMKNPERYRTLTVRLYGFSEYFISLPEWQQTAVLNRTEYC